MRKLLLLITVVLAGLLLAAVRIPQCPPPGIDVYGWPAVIEVSKGEDFYIDIKVQPSGPRDPDKYRLVEVLCYYDTEHIVCTGVEWVDVDWDADWHIWHWLIDPDPNDPNDYDYDDGDFHWRGYIQHNGLPDLTCSDEPFPVRFTFQCIADGESTVLLSQGSGC